MVNVGPPEPIDNVKLGAKPRVVGVLRRFILFLIAVLLLVAAVRLLGTASYFEYLVARATVFDTWDVLNIVEGMLSVVAVAGAVLALWRVKLIPALAFAILPLPALIIIEGSGCDTTAACRALGWAALPAQAFRWEVRLRPVTDRNEAERIASVALYKGGLDGSPYEPRRFADHWIVPAINQDGWASGHAVRIDTRSAETRLVVCPADKVQCGMARPTVSDGRTPFRHDGLGLSARFPVSLPVCRSEGDDNEPNGFVALMRSPDIPCETLDGARKMGVEIAQYRIDGCSVVENRDLPWRPLSPEIAKHFRTATPSLGGQPSVACELHEQGYIQISVYAFSEERSNPAQPAGRPYQGYIVTTPDHLSEDVRSFEVFLKSVRIDTTPEGLASE